MVKWLVILALLPALAHANEIATDVVVKKEPSLPRDRSLGFRIGAMNMDRDDHRRTMIAIGAQWNVALAGSLRAMVTYDYLIAAGDEDPEMAPVRGRGHAGRIGGRFALLDKTVRNEALLYLGLEATGGVAYVTDNYLGPKVLPHAVVGVRLGYELWGHEPSSQSSMFGAHILAGTTITPGDIGFVFQVGMEWGQRAKR